MRLFTRCTSTFLVLLTVAVPHGYGQRWGSDKQWSTPPTSSSEATSSEISSDGSSTQFATSTASTSETTVFSSTDSSALSSVNRKTDQSSPRKSTDGSSTESATSTTSATSSTSKTTVFFSTDRSSPRRSTDGSSTESATSTASTASSSSETAAFSSTDSSALSSVNRENPTSRSAPLSTTDQSSATNKKAPLTSSAPTSSITPSSTPRASVTSSSKDASSENTTTTKAPKTSTAPKQLLSTEPIILSTVTVGGVQIHYCPIEVALTSTTSSLWKSSSPSPSPHGAWSSSVSRQASSSTTSTASSQNRSSSDPDFSASSSSLSTSSTPQRTRLTTFAASTSSTTSEESSTNPPELPTSSSSSTAIINDTTTEESAILSSATDSSATTTSSSKRFSMTSSPVSSATSTDTESVSSSSSSQASYSSPSSQKVTSSKPPATDISTPAESSPSEISSVSGMTSSRSVRTSTLRTSSDSSTTTSQESTSEAGQSSSTPSTPLSSEAPQSESTQTPTETSEASVASFIISSSSTLPATSETASPEPTSESEDTTVESTREDDEKTTHSASTDSLVDLENVSSSTTGTAVSNGASSTQSDAEESTTDQLSTATETNTETESGFTDEIFKTNFATSSASLPLSSTQISSETSSLEPSTSESPEFPTTTNIALIQESPSPDSSSSTKTTLKMSIFTLPSSSSLSSVITEVEGSFPSTKEESSMATSIGMEEESTVSWQSEANGVQSTDKVATKLQSEASEGSSSVKPTERTTIFKGAASSEKTNGLPLIDSESTTSSMQLSSSTILQDSSSRSTMTTSQKATKASSTSSRKLDSSPRSTAQSVSSTITDRKISSIKRYTSTAAAASESTPPSSTISEDPQCAQRCPPNYLIGTSYCFLLMRASSKINSYQSALSFCKTVERQTLASLDKIRDSADLRLIQESAGLNNIDWIYANGIGGKEERFDKMAAVYSIFNQSLVSSPILKSVGISEKFENISALCVLPQYCDSTECNVEKLFLAYDYYSRFSQTAGTLAPQQTGTVKCLYGNQKKFIITCNTLGTIYPNPSNLDCEEATQERQIRDTTNNTVTSCDVCFGRGTKECQGVQSADDELAVGFRCICKEPYTMANCWRTVNPCNSIDCGPNGKCKSEMGQMVCDCDWGFTGDRCDKRLSEQFDGDIGYSSLVGATITIGGMLFRALKIAIMGFGMTTDQGDDPQDTHQRLRSYSITGAGIILCLYSNPTLFAITQTACRFYFIAIHFCYLLAMIQWVLEAWNVNQVLRAVHLNEWERDWNGDRPWGVRIVPRMTLSIGILITVMLVTFQTGWNRLAASWTCVGVICQQTLSIWIPLFSGVFILALFAIAIYESSTLIKSRRPLLGYRIDMKIEREMGCVDGRRVEKCRDNELLTLIGLLLLITQWISVIISSDHRDVSIYGILTVIIAGCYSTFCSYQEIVTCPEDRAVFLELLQRWAPPRFAPEYNPVKMWTIQEVREHYKTPKTERAACYEGFLSRNQHLYLHHRWDVLLSHYLSEDPELSVNNGLLQIFIMEMRRLNENGGAVKLKNEVKKSFAEYIKTIPHKDARDIRNLKGRIELVTLAAEDPLHGIKLSKFFIVPKFHTFEPEHPEKEDSDDNAAERIRHRRFCKDRESDIYELARQGAQAQTKFVNSAILFSSYGNNVVR